MLQVSKLTAGYGLTQVLRGLSLQVTPGEVLAVCGPNGAGKSTLLRTIAGQVRPTAGDITYRYTSLSTAAPSAIVAAGVSLCPEGRRVFPRMSTEANLRLGAYTRKDTTAIQADIDAYLEQWPVIARRRQSPAGLLSGGEQQILAIGRAMMSKPTLLLLDEPSLGLAPVLIDQVYSGLRKLAASKQLSILLVEQNVIKALQLCDRIAVLSNGVISFESKAGDTGPDEVGMHYFSTPSAGTTS